MSEKFAFIVGAPRCGTTSLSAYLQYHPGVSFSLVKEPHFFTRVGFAALSARHQRRLIEKDYLPTYFPQYAPGSEAVHVEGSVSYLYAPEEMAALVRIWPEARFIIALRDPLHMLPSLHQRLLFMGDETEPDFERAWALIGDRRRGLSIPASCVDPKFLFYDDIGRLGHHVERFIAAVGRERCFFSLFDDFSADPQAVYRDLIAFLGLPDMPLHDVSAHRPTVGFKSPWLQRLLNRPPGVTRWETAEKLWLRVKQAQNSSGRSILRAIWQMRKRLLRWNEAPPAPKGLSPRLESAIRHKFADDVDLLGHILGRDLGGWLGRTNSPADPKPGLDGESRDVVHERSA